MWKDAWRCGGRSVHREEIDDGRSVHGGRRCWWSLRRRRWWRAAAALGVETTVVKTNGAALKMKTMNCSDPERP